MAAGAGGTTPAGDPSGAQMMRVLIPAAAIALVVIATAVIVSGCDGGNPGSGKGGGPVNPGAGGYPPPTGGTDVTKMTDGSDPTAEDPGLRDIGGGLKVRDLKEGDGPEVRPGDSVTAYYTGWLTNGTVFDSSRRKGEPVPFSLNEVVPGWGRGIPGMKLGGIRKLVIPPDLAYGPAGRPGIPPNSTLIFEVELVKR
jgi:hypothetical protein